MKTKTKTKVNTATAIAVLGAAALIAAGMIFFSAKDFTIQKGDQNQQIDFNNVTAEEYAIFNRAVSGCESKTGIKIDESSAMTEKEENLFRDCLRSLNDKTVNAIVDFIDNPDSYIMANNAGDSGCGCRYSNSNHPAMGDACIIDGYEGTCGGKCGTASRDCAKGFNKATFGQKASVWFSSWGGNMN